MLGCWAFYRLFERPITMALLAIENRNESQFSQRQEPRDLSALLAPALEYKTLNVPSIRDSGLPSMKNFGCLIWQGRLLKLL